ncbi:MAG: hypothetical protein F4Y14_04620 [Acidobacteria bacterium]|nr:hypothetical protein [Acidobacteriota bacterium]
MRHVDAVGAWCALGYAALAFAARQPGEPDLATFFALVAWTGLPVFGLYLYFRRRGEPFPVGRLIFWAVVFRICGLAGGPFYEDDFYRYLWDAYRFATTGTPYGAAPEEFFVDPGVPLPFQGVLDGINYPELPTIYGPTTQLVFLLGFWIQPASVGVLQAILIGLDLVTVALLLRLTTPANVLLYAWCPLVVKEIAFTAHPDGAGVCLLLAAIVLARDRRWPSAAVCLGLAAGAKTFGLVLAPLVLARAGVGHWFLFGATLAGVNGPFALFGGTGLASEQVFARDWGLSSARYGLLATFMPRFESRLLLAFVFASAWCYYFLHVRRGVHGIPRGDWVFGALLASSPVINPWYLLWLLPFAAVWPSVWAWTASVAILLSYVTGLNLQDYEMHPYAQPLWARWLQFGTILAGLGFDLAGRRRPASGGPVDAARR